jgi:hypothetical protein
MNHQYGMPAPAMPKPEPCLGSWVGEWIFLGSNRTRTKGQSRRRIYCRAEGLDSAERDKIRRLFTYFNLRFMFSYMVRRRSCVGLDIFVVKVFLIYCREPCSFGSFVRCDVNWSDGPVVRPHGSSMPTNRSD